VLPPGLHVVATPIGNLGDITLRALWTLRQADRIFCEDTRVTARLLARYGIDKPLAPYHDHNADRVRPGILDALRRGERLALVSDAGTPLVSDPGYKLLRAAVAEGLTVTAAPGPSAAIAALTLSGLPPDAFLFAGLARYNAGHHSIRIHCRHVGFVLGWRRSNAAVPFVFFVAVFSFFAFNFLAIFVLPHRLVRQVIHADLNFFRRRGTAEHDPVGFLDPGCIVRFRFNTACEQFGLLLHEIAIHEKQPLQRHVCAEALFG